MICLVYLGCLKPEASMFMWPTICLLDLDCQKPEACVSTDFILFSPTGRSDGYVSGLCIHRGLSGVHSSPCYFTLHFPVLSVRIHFS